MAFSQPQRAGTVKSPYRIPVHELGVKEDQSDAQAFLNGIKNGFGIVGEAGAFYLFFEDQARGEYIRVFRSPLLHGEPARWTAAEEFQPLPKTVPVQQPWYLGWLQWRNDLAARRQDDWNNYSRFVKLPWKEGVFKRPPAPDPNTPDYGVLIDKLIDGQYGMETLGLRPANQFDIDAINRAAGWKPGTNNVTAARMGDWIFDGFGRRTPDNVGKYEGKGCGKVSKRAGIITPDDLLYGWTEAKTLAMPNVMCGTGGQGGKPAECVPTFRVEHPTNAQRPGFRYPYGYQPGITIRHGARIFNTRTEEQIQEFADRKGYAGAKRVSAVNCYRGACDFGGQVGETSGMASFESVGYGNPIHDAGFRVAGVPTAAELWEIFDGFWTPETTRVANDARIDMAR